MPVALTQRVTVTQGVLVANIRTIRGLLRGLLGGLFYHLWCYNSERLTYVLRGSLTPLHRSHHNITK